MAWRSGSGGEGRSAGLWVRPLARGKRRAQPRVRPLARGEQQAEPRVRSAARNEQRARPSARATARASGGPARGLDGRWSP
ncbi:MAG: hypothetical protein U9R72_16510 [Chloroflexota bacterium]|nr:hypothetical protein [Chloroflexota bacterium]